MTCDFELPGGISFLCPERKFMPIPFAPVWSWPLLAALCQKLKLPRTQRRLLAMWHPVGAACSQRAGRSIYRISGRPAQARALVIILLKAGLSLDLGGLKGRPSGDLDVALARNASSAGGMPVPCSRRRAEARSARCSRRCRPRSPRMVQLMESGRGTDKSILQMTLPV